jgi:mRNA interferase HicA
LKRRDLIKLLEENGCVFLRHGGRHDIYLNPITAKTQGIPRHTEVKESVAKNILIELGVQWRTKN